MSTSRCVVECVDKDMELPCGSFQVDEGILYVYRRPDNVGIVAVFNAFEWKKVIWQ